MTALISVVIPVYNRGRELQRALDSLQAQTARNFEVIVCDDGSSEDIHAVVRPYEDTLDLRYVRIPNSGGPARPRNVAISHARGDWIAMLDSDDWWDAERLAVVSAALDENVDLLYHRLRVVRAPGLRRPRERRAVIGEPPHRNVLRQLLVFGNPVPNSAAVLRRSRLEQLGGISEDPALIEDFDTWLRLAAAGGRLRFVDRVLGSYWVGEDAISAVSRAQIGKYAATFERHVPALDAADRDLAWRCHRYHVGSMFLKLGGEPVLARSYLLGAGNLPTLKLKLKRALLLLRTFL